MKSLSHIENIRRRLRVEKGTQWRPGAQRMAVAYPSPYKLGSSSLGFQHVISLLRNAGISAERAFFPDDSDALATRKRPVLTYESQTPLGGVPIIGISLSYELELISLIKLLTLSGVPPLRRDRGPKDPVILLGGPITFSNPLPASPFVDAMLIGEADHTIVPAVQAFFDSRNRIQWLNAVCDLNGGFVPEFNGEKLPSVGVAPNQHIPAKCFYTSPETELTDMFLIEGERGCHRTCSFCVMRRSADNGGMRLVEPDHLLSLIPATHKKVGLVGAAISDHPKLPKILENLIEQGHQVSVSSLRADRIARKPIIAELLRKSGANNLTVASDGASASLRRSIKKGTTETHLRRCAEIARELEYKSLKIYMMLGLPNEDEADIDELIRDTVALSKLMRINLGVAPFVAKRNTPLDGAPWAGTKKVEAHIKKLTRGLKGRAVVRPTSARWAWVEWALAQHGSASGEALMRAEINGGGFANLQKQLKSLPPESFRPWA